MQTPRLRRQRGLALILMTIILVLGTTYIVIDQMNSVSQRFGQDRTTNDALALAKEALIGHSANNFNRPGALPCPDTNNDGNAEATCANANQQVGRLPWKTLGLPDLRDSAGERLWYALSDAFRDTGIVNSNTAGQLTLRDDVANTVVASNVVAMVFAPGAQVSVQDRSTAAKQLLVENYLEGNNDYTRDALGTNDNVFVQPRPTAAYPRGECKIGGVASECNDRALAITHSDLFSVVENLVAKRMEIEIKPLLTSYRTVFGAYPFPRTFADPKPPLSAPLSTTWIGTAGNTYGQLPMTTDKAMFTWVTTAGSAPTIACPLCGAVVVSSSCAASLTTQVRCTFQYICGAPTVTITARVAGIGLGYSMFTDPYTLVDGKLNWNHFLDNGATYFLQTTGIAGGAGHSVSFGALNADGSQTMTYTAPLLYRGCANDTPAATPITRTLTLKSISQMGFIGGSPFIPALTKTGYATDWYVRNEWYKLVLYAVAAGYAPGGAASCTPPNCLTVNDTDLPDTKGVILVFAGRAIGTQDRTLAPGAVGSYFERQNSTPADRIYEQTPRSTTFNDKVVVVEAPPPP
jgi:hypothetical protein